jgi:hypothetical protein
MDLLTTYTHDPELQAITAPPLMSTVHKSPQQPLSLFQAPVSLPAVTRKRLPKLKILQLDASKSSLNGGLVPNASSFSQSRFPQLSSL